MQAPTGTPAACNAAAAMADGLIEGKVLVEEASARQDEEHEVRSARRPLLSLLPAPPHPNGTWGYMAALVTFMDSPSPLLSGPATLRGGWTWTGRRHHLTSCRDCTRLRQSSAQI